MDPNKVIETINLAAVLATVGIGIAQRLGIDPAGRTAEEILAEYDARIEEAGRRAREAEEKLREALGG